MTQEDKIYYSDGYQPLFNLMVKEWSLHLLESEMYEIINCVRLMDESHAENTYTEKEVIKLLEAQRQVHMDACDMYVSPSFIKQDIKGYYYPTLLKKQS